MKRTKREEKRDEWLVLVLWCVGSEESEVRKRTLLSSLHTSQHKEQGMVVCSVRKKESVLPLPFFLYHNTTPLILLFPFPFNLNTNEGNRMRGLN